VGSSVTYGFLIVAVNASSPAESAGLNVDDIIIGINDTQIISGDDVSNYLEEYTSPGQTIKLIVERRNPVRTVAIYLVLGTRPPPSS